MLLDVVLPETDGYSVCRELRSQGDTPVIFLSCRADESDKIRGFDAGGDDYVTKPFSPRELVARVKARLRSRDARPPSRSSHVLRVGRLEIDTLLQRVTVDGRPVRLSAKEYRILCLLASRSGQTVGFRELCRDLWGRDTVRDLRTLTVHIRNLRKKTRTRPCSSRTHRDRERNGVQTGIMKTAAPGRHRHASREFHNCGSDRGGKCAVSEPVQTLEGWYALHDFRFIDWNVWKSWTSERRERALRELFEAVAQYRRAESEKRGSFAWYAIVGQKADMLFLHLRETLEQLNDIENAFNKTAFAEATRPAYSFVSVVELSGYTAKPGADPREDPEIAARLYPILPKTEYVCFYPMNKRRLGEDNWYMLPIDRRRELMRSHGAIGRKYHGVVRQIITGSVGLDDWEWGVTLFSDDALQFKKLVYEMRFDEASARFAEFGPFFVGRRLDEKPAADMLAL